MKWKVGSITIDILPPVKRYMNGIERQLRVDRKTRVRIMTELAGDFQSRRESGQSDEQIMAELGTPAEVAAQFNAAFGGVGTASRWRWAFVVLAVVVVAATLIAQLAAPTLPAGAIGGADGPTSIYVAGAPLENMIGVLPWLLGCIAGFLLPNWRNPRTGKGYGASLLLSGLGILPLCLIVMELVIVACTTTLPAAQLGAACWALLSGFFLNGEWLCAAVFGWACIARNRAKKGDPKSTKKN